MDLGVVHQLEFVPLSPGGWRLCDRSVSSNDPASVVAYVEERRGALTVVWLVGQRAPSRAADLGEVLLQAIDRVSRPSQPRARPFPIPHRAPLMG
ncbi:hypothetical protein [Microbacterium allomyrinae]|uniref:Uncharacterized protein n=1 Tax=Microbacterium allomyrinae TaxID=2830666 RepID=A0A9X1LTK3_9MICO|nr:hypothetical protein [Microbacterium allomyrinae]MCC2031418.1 hypothetical protein [Microbacterium allomyrinae]